MGALESPRRWSVVWRTAALHAWLVGLGFGLPCVYAIWYFADQGLVWTFMGFPTYGEGPFEDVGLVTTVPLLVAFLLVCLAELVMGWLLWSRRRSGVVLSLVLLPLELAFWIGFLLPYGFVVGAARTVLVLIASTFTNRTEAGSEPADRSRDGRSGSDRGAMRHGAQSIARDQARGSTPTDRETFRSSSREGFHLPALTDLGVTRINGQLLMSNGGYA